MLVNPISHMHCKPGIMRFYPASSLIQSLCNVRLSPKFKNSQQARIHKASDAVSRRLAQNRKKTNIQGLRTRVIYTRKSAIKMSNCKDDKIQELYSVRVNPKIVRQIQERQETWLFMTKLRTGYVMRCHPHDVLPSARSPAPPFA